MKRFVFVSNHGVYDTAVVRYWFPHFWPPFRTKCHRTVVAERFLSFMYPAAIQTNDETPIYYTAVAPGRRMLRSQLFHSFSRIPIENSTTDALSSSFMVHVSPYPPTHFTGRDAAAYK